MRRYNLWFIASLILVLSISGFIYWVFQPSLSKESAHEIKEKDPFIDGRELLYSGQYKESEEKLKMALRNDPANVKALSALGTVYHRQGDMKRAYQYWFEALKIVPNDAILQGLVKEIERDKDKTEPGPLDHMGIKTVDHAPSWEKHFTNGQNLYIKGDYPQSIEELKKASSLRPDDSQIRFVLGAAYLKLDHKDRTVQEWEKALSLNPEDRMIRELLGKLKNRYNNEAH